MGSDPDARLALPRRLRALREEHWPGIRVTQGQLAAVLDPNRRLSVPLISSWESVTDPKIPPLSRLEAYATFFATRRSVDEARLLDQSELTTAERTTRNELRADLLRLRGAALRGMSSGPDKVIESLSSGYWHFADGGAITIVSARLPDHLRKRVLYSDPADPDFISMSAYADLDALFELYGHIRATNPATNVRLRMAPMLGGDDYTAHLISLGGVDWNQATRSVLAELNLPVRQIADWDSPAGPYFEVVADGPPQRFHPRLDRTGGRPTLTEDVALFARAVNPFNQRRTVTICSGMYGRGTFGAVRGLTDEVFRDRNTDYARVHFGEASAFCILVRVPVVNGEALTPDWTKPENRLFEWASDSYGAAREP